MRDSSLDPFRDAAALDWRVAVGGDCSSWGGVYMGSYGDQGEYSRRRSSVSAVPTASDLAVPVDCRSYWHRSVFVEWRDYEGSYGHEEVHY